MKTEGKRTRREGGRLCDKRKRKRERRQKMKNRLIKER